MCVPGEHHNSSCSKMNRAGAELVNNVAFAYLVLAGEADIISPDRTDSVVTNNDRNTLQHNITITSHHFISTVAVSTGHLQIISNI